MGGSQTKQERPVWPPGWLDIPDEPRLLARTAILAISAEDADTFLMIASESYCIAEDAWDFEEYHAAAAAAMQEDIKLNRLTYVLVPRRISEIEFWRLYFSKVLHILDSVKQHGTYPPPAPEPAPAEEPLAPPPASEPAPEQGSSCLLQ